jgi:hypothetical protein
MNAQEQQLRASTWREREQRFGHYYGSGFACALFGPDTRNCDFKLFNDPLHTLAWEQGKVAGDAWVKAHEAQSI